MTSTRTYHLLVPAFLAGLVLVLMTSLSVIPSAVAANGDNGCAGRYGWPVKPFDREHPVRGNFGDPRTVFSEPPTRRGLMSSGGSFSFHQGIDISVRNGTPVYPVASGTVTAVTHEWIRVDCGNGRAFEYWHISPRVRIGQRVERGRTPLGFVVRPAEHVHLTHTEDGKAVNPLALGRLAPYTDTTIPQVNAITLRHTEDGEDELPSFVRGRMLLLADVSDTPSMAVPGLWNALPVTPALVTWRIQTWNGKVVVRTRTGRDVRQSIPRNEDFWRTYARGTFQNMAVFGSHYSFLQQGRYLVKLTRAPFDTRALPDGVYDLVVTATDIRGNASSRSLRITVHNRPGWIGS
jgi:hypothetical protein